MKKQAFFGLVFGSWMIGVFLICLFPPIPDYGIVHQTSGHICLDSAPEFHLRNTFQTGSSKVPVANRFLDSNFGFLLDSERLPSSETAVAPISTQISPLFDVRILFQMYFETT